ncbi:adenylate kinase [Halocatena pleomorpha]|uniref:Adenylate kinase n=1 Tax=Halocatena pleomorpha TaxID=1785090 RepID=A0A3P3RCG2_9EURY|nr:adenylate kinase [Halocatena pleomorpha]RRJ30380.1 adenylate kinase [Halocatena pleomorpha]
MDEHPRILLLGPPGAGKGTQSEHLVDAYDIEHVTTGDALRANKDMETEYGTPREFMDAGELVPDPVVNEIVAEAVSNAEGFVLDGYPRNLSQAEYLDDITDLDCVLFLAVDRDELLRRLTGRRVCPGCNKTYHVEFNPPETEGVCDDCGSELTQRDDDTEAVVSERLDVYEENTEPVVEFYRDRGDLIEVDGEGSPEDVWENLHRQVETVVSE